MLRMETYHSGAPLKCTDAVCSLMQKQMASVGSPKSTEQIEHALQSVFKPSGRAILFIGYDGDIPAAFAFGNIATGIEAGGDYFWLNELYVDTPYRNRGYASTLLAFAENRLKNEGISYFACVTGNENAAAQAVFRKQGFALDSIIWVDKSIRPE